MMTYFLSSATGFLAGTGHVLSGPDHLAAVVPFAASQRSKSWYLGFLWGVGHSGGVWILSILAIAFREALPIELLSAWGERLVGFVLVAIGLIILRRLIGSHVHSHEHEHDGVRHVHVHVHASSPADDHAIEHQHSHSVLGIGVLHGLAGTAHLLGVIPALLLPTRTAAIVYVLSFGIGSIVAMTVFSWIVGLVANRFEQMGNRMFRLLMVSCCVATMLVGVYWCYSSFTQVPVAS